MLNTVKDFFSSAADVTLPFARSVGVSSTDLVKSFGAGTVSIAKDIGPKRALIGFAIVAAAVGGGILLARYLRTREDDQQDDASSTREAGGGAGPRSRKLRRAERRAVNAHNAAAGMR